MTKDRLQEMRKLMQEDKNDDDRDNKTQEKSTPLITFFEHARLLCEESEIPDEICIKIPREKARAVKLEIQDLRNRVNDLKILLNNNQEWGNRNSRENMEHKIEEQKLVVGNLARAIRSNIKSMKSTHWDTKGVSVIQRIKDVQLSTILNELNEILRDYLQCLVQHRERLVKIFRDMLEVRGDGITDIDTLLEEGKIAIFNNNLLIGDMEERFKLREAEEGHIEIAEKVEEVEKLVDENLTKVESGNAKLTSARKNKGKLRYKKLMVALICGGVILIVLVIFTII